MPSSNHEEYKRQLTLHGVDETTATLAAQGCTALDEGRDRTDTEQSAIEAAAQIVISNIKGKNGKT